MHVQAGITGTETCVGHVFIPVAHPPIWHELPVDADVGSELERYAKLAGFIVFPADDCGAETGIQLEMDWPVLEHEFGAHRANETKLAPALQITGCRFQPRNDKEVGADWPLVNVPF